LVSTRIRVFERIPPAVHIGVLGGGICEVPFECIRREEASGVGIIVSDTT